MGRYYQGIIKSYDASSGKHRIDYADGDSAEHELKHEAVIWMSDGNNSSTPASGLPGSEASAPTPTKVPVQQQQHAPAPLPSVPTLQQQQQFALSHLPSVIAPSPAALGGALGTAALASVTPVIGHGRR